MRQPLLVEKNVIFGTRKTDNFWSVQVAAYSSEISQAEKARFRGVLRPGFDTGTRPTADQKTPETRAAS